MPRTANATIKKKHGNDARAQAWRSIRILRHFSIGEIVMTGNIQYDNARRYLQRLEACGVIRLQAKNRTGHAGSFKRWHLMHDLGPRAPIVRTNGSLYDPNSGTVMAAKEPANDSQQQHRLAPCAR